ncbi:MAG: hypothetical protein NT004_02400 [Bacteroidetes bacterium]|nr:hypothetical protein [Bacteroidota bacterium]
MKKFALIFVPALICFGLHTNAQKLYGFGYRQVEPLLMADTINITPAHTQTVYTLVASSTDATIIINAVTAKAVPGDKIILRITGATPTRTIVFGANLNAPSDTVANTKIKLYEFIYIGTAYDLISAAAVN